MWQKPGATKGRTDRERRFVKQWNRQGLGRGKRNFGDGGKAAFGQKVVGRKEKGGKTGPGAACASVKSPKTGRLQRRNGMTSKSKANNEHYGDAPGEPIVERKSTSKEKRRKPRAYRKNSGRRIRFKEKRE